MSTLKNVQYNGDIMSTPGVFSTMEGYHEYHGGYHEYTGGVQHNSGIP